ncbi:integrase [Brevibacterium phage 4C]|uniref:Integrase n=31 Tax=Agmunavirus AGM1 TaxID=2843882 RepID=A0A7D0GJS5_9CAUD|nr:integrase [Brevibacterium phage AGM1]QDH85674.1 integrase [Brevibacterium phage AGM2]QDH85727.1 integrase [Brevibacterium phage AGM3]QDH85780.1 integrase [Brevibacterium phage AGM4]QDH85833.1 integrase [Brevibacterium phage AGM5]QDH85886.1 integrase [Brevibacterium phage AGM6]QDH85939.1 integrase [Brevibacterium phage AGM7]QDH85992.1 integrase [Brevibacterium phage AGM8]QDH86045.1 integrase [Brevibacterium phage AGM9]QDH86098.1 integrase [Brevibacterium phage AGM10]QDH86151.1 integrase
MKRRSLTNNDTNTERRQYENSTTLVARYRAISEYELLGHASVQTTQIYTAIPNGALRAAVDGIRA